MIAHPHNMSHRRNLAAPSTMDPTTKKHSFSSNPTNIIKHPNPIPIPIPIPIPSSTLHKLKPHFPKPNFFNSTHIPTPSSSLKSPDPPRVVDIHLQAKSLTLSANADSSSYLLKKPHSHQIRHQQPQQQKHPMEAKQGIEKKIKPRQGNRDPEPEPELVEDIDLKLSSVSLNGGRRKSWSDSKIDLVDFFFNLSARVVSVDMPPFMQIHAVSCARKVYDSFEKASSSKTLASTLKKEFDGVYGPAWHCIVGTSFGSFVTHSVNGFFYFSLDHKLYILLFKTTVQRAD